MFSCNMRYLVMGGNVTVLKFPITFFLHALIRSMLLVER